MHGPVAPLRQEPFAAFERDDGRALPLWDGYRDAIKRGWRIYWWPTMALYALRGTPAATADIERLAQEIDAARSLPVPLAEVAAVVAQAAAGHPGVAVLDDAVDGELGVPALEVRPALAAVERSAAMYRDSAERILELLARHGGRPRSALEVGCSTGCMGVALAAAGIAEVLATDIQEPGFLRRLEREAVRAALAGKPAGRSPGRCSFGVADVTALDFPDATFDLVYSVSTLEHVHDPAAAFREIARVLRPGGLSYHGVDPWFSPQGGHSLCTLDAPWGHARLTEAELRRYFAEVRPHEAASAIAFHDEAFQQPRLSFAELRAATEAAGLEVVSWKAHPGYLEHRALAAGLLGEVRERNAAVTVPELLATGLTIVLRRR